MPLTIKDVAERLKLSITTVSRALDGYADVSETTRARVRATAAEMGYAPSHNARQMRRQRTDTIGYVLPITRHSDEGSRALADPYFSTFIAGLGDETARHNLDLLVSVATEADEQAIYRRWVQGRRVDGFVINRMRLNDWRSQFLQQSNMPFVANGRERGEVSYPFIEMNSRAGFRALVMHLAAQGHTRIAFVSGPPHLRSSADRLAGYRDGLRAAGLGFDKTLLASGDLTAQGGGDAARSLLTMSNPPSAILGSNDMTALGVLRAATALGRKPGHDLAVAGFDGTEAALHADPPLTTMAHPAYEIARDMVRMLVSLLRGETIAQSQRVLEPQLVLRASSQCKPA